jgi:hypothetical protein
MRRIELNVLRVELIVGWELSGNCVEGLMAGVISCESLIRFCLKL